MRSALTEAAVACHLWRRGCELEVEVPSRSGRTADFLVTRGAFRFALHVKRWSLDPASAATLRVPAAVRQLERIRRPYLAAVQWPQERRELDRFVAEAGPFLEHASVGDELVVRDAGGRAVGGARILAPWPGDRIALTVGLDAALDDELPRLQRQLRKAHAQFMPGVPNVILLVGGSAGDERLVDTALLGSHVERWDRFPPRGHRIAHGRAEDGFWSGGRYAQSSAMAWAPWSDAKGLGAVRLWLRTPGTLDELRPLLR